MYCFLIRNFYVCNSNNLGKNKNRIDQIERYLAFRCVKASLRCVVVKPEIFIHTLGSKLRQHFEVSIGRSRRIRYHDHPVEEDAIAIYDRGTTSPTRPIQGRCHWNYSSSHLRRRMLPRRCLLPSELHR